MDSLHAQGWNDFNEQVPGRWTNSWARETYPLQCQKCGDAGMHYPSHCHTQGEGHTCCECLGHGYVPTPSGYVCKQLKAEQDSREGETLADMTSGHASIVNMEDFECFEEA